MIPAGGLSLDHQQWIHPRYAFFLPGIVLGRMFRRKFLALLAAAFRRKKLRLEEPLQPLQRLGAFDRFVSSLRKPKWVVEVRAPFGGPEHVLRYLARYTHRVTISNGRRAKALKLGRTLLRVSPQPDPLSIQQRNAIRRKCPCCGIGTLCLLGYVPASLLNSSMMPVCVTLDSS